MSVANQNKILETALKTKNTKTLKIDIDLIERLKIIADYKKRTQHYLMKEAIQAYVEQEEEKIAFLVSAEKASEHYASTGLHLKLDEFQNWLDNVNENNILPIPVCHK
jgi:predicted transcriptional regulator